MLICSFHVALALAAAAGCAAARQGRTPSAISPMTLDRLPMLPHAVSVCEFSSHNKQGVNGDAEWHLYKDEHGDAVVLDVAGPGCIRSIWETDANPAQFFKFYFDGEKEPRYTIRVTDLFQGKHPLFPEPLTTWKVVGRYAGDQYAGNCFVPIPFAKSLKVAIQGPYSFYHFMVERYPVGTPVETFSGKEDRGYLIDAFERQGQELERVAGAETLRAAADTMEPGGRFDLLNQAMAGTVCRVAVECEATEEALHSLEIEAQWDESRMPDVLAPVGMFFGCAVRPEDVKALPIRVEKLEGGRMRLTSFFRMPFWRHGRLTLVNRGTKALGRVSAEADLAPNSYKEDDTGTFHAMYREGRTEMGRDWLFCDAIGTGRFVGVVQTMFGSHYCEGDEHFTVDGAGMPQVNGTGSEDYYLACYWPNRNFNLPFAGCVGDIFLQPGPACYYRFHIEAPIPFYKSLDARIQHGGNSDIVSQYRSVGFFYLRRRPAMKETDLIDVGNVASERSHGYHAGGSKLAGPIDAFYEGNASQTPIRDEGREHDGGEIRFAVAIDPKNSGVKLRRRLDQKIGRQVADVYVDGKLVGTWYHADENPFLRWFDSDFELPAEFTRGHESLSIRLAVHKGAGAGVFTDYRYEAFCYEER